MTHLQLLWIIFIVISVAMFCLDIKLSAQHVHEINRKEAAKLCLTWIVITVVFGLLSGWLLDKTRMIQFFTGYVIEYSLSVDNMFVFIMIFEAFNVKRLFQPKILTWGILGAVVMRLILIFAGVELMSRFHWLLYVFGAVLIFTAAKMAFGNEGEEDPRKNPVIRLLGKIMPLDHDDHSGVFFVKKDTAEKKAVWHATTLFVTLLVIETSDIVFAMDSIPAVLGISQETFVVYTSNIFAVVGLRSLYFLLASIMDIFRFLKPAVSIILCFVGVKMLGEHWFRISPGISLCVIIGVLATAILLSVLLPRKDSGNGLHGA